MTREQALALKKRLEVEIATRGYASLSPRKKEGYDTLRKFFGQIPAMDAIRSVHIQFSRASRAPQDQPHESIH